MTYEPNTKVNVTGQAGFIVRMFAILGGVLLCFTGIGILVGLPLFLWGCLSKTDVVGVFRGVCPKCNNELLMPKAVSAGDCPYCKARIVRSETEFQIFT